MARERAANYEEKMAQIKDTAATMFAEAGYTSTKMADIATACGASKSMLYHYFPTKDDLLFSMIDDHLRSTVDGLSALQLDDSKPGKSFEAFLEIFLKRSSDGRQRNMVALNDLRFLPSERQKPLIALERQVMDLIVEMLRLVNPNLRPDLYKTYGLMLVGMLNWTDTWYNPRGTIKPKELVERASRLFLDGFLAEK